MAHEPLESPKTQLIRLADIAFVGPIMIYASFHMDEDKEWAAFILRGLGMATILFNAQNMRLISEARAQKLNTSPDLP